MTLHIYRVIVRGRFDGLDASTRAALLAEADQHTVAQSAFTETGTLTYDRSLGSFGFRVQVRERGDDAMDAEAHAVEQAERLAGKALALRGAAGRDLRISATNMADAWSRAGRPR
jgi:hypothetical protein